MLQIAFVETVFLRACLYDIKPWRLAQLAVLIVNSAGLYSIRHGLAGRGRLDPVL